MRYQFIVDFQGTLAELLASFPPGAELVSLHHVLDKATEPKPSGARTHMAEHVIDGIFADLDAGLTIERIVAKTGYSNRAIAERRKEWKLRRGI